MRLVIAFVSALAGKVSTSVGAPTRKNPLTSTSLPLSPDDSFNFQMLINLGSVPYAAADILAAAKVIVPNSFYSFNTTFYDLATGKVAAAEKASKSQMLSHETPTRLQCFNKAIATLPVPGVRVKIPSDGFDVIGIYYVVDNSDTKRPTLVIIQGYDAAQEDSYFQIGVTALARGYNVFTIEGPGQPTVRRYRDLGFIPDYEKVTTPAVDYLVNNRSPQTDMEKLTLVEPQWAGISQPEVPLSSLVSRPWS